MNYTPPNVSIGILFRGLIILEAILGYLLPHSSIGASSSARDPFNQIMTAHWLYEYTSASNYDGEDIDNEDDAIPSSEEEDLDLHNPRFANVHSHELEEHTDETHTP